MLDIEDILATHRMFEENRLDVRTVTLGVSLLGCIDRNGETMCQKIYDHICRVAENLVPTAEAISREYGVPIINKRVAVTPISLIAEASDLTDYAPVAQALDRAAKTCGIDFLGGFSALVQNGITRGDQILLDSVPEALATTDRVCSSIGIGSTKSGINMDAVRQIGEIIKKTAALTADNDALGCAKLVAFCNPVEDNPFMAGAFHGVTQGDLAVHVGVSGPGVVKRALKETAFMVTRVGQLVAQVAAERLHAPFGIIDLSLAPTSEIGDSVAKILEEMGLESCGAPGTTAALALLNDAVKKGGMMAASRVGGLSGAFIPVSEDLGMIEAVERGSLTLEKLEAMTCVCSVGLDMIAVPGDTSAATLAAILADEAAIGMINNKTTATRLIPVPGKKVGDLVEFGGLLGYAPVIAVNRFDASEFIARGGRIPAPVRSLTN